MKTLKITSALLLAVSMFACTETTIDPIQTPARSTNATTVAVDSVSTSDAPAMVQPADGQLVPTRRVTLPAPTRTYPTAPQAAPATVTDVDVDSPDKTPTERPTAPAVMPLEVSQP
jgi:hypothetical protein